MTAAGIRGLSSEELTPGRASPAAATSDAQSHTAAAAQPPAAAAGRAVVGFDSVSLDRGSQAVVSNVC